MNISTIIKRKLNILHHLSRKVCTNYLNDPLPRTSVPIVDHTYDEVGMWYTFPQQKVNEIFKHGGIPVKYEQFIPVFNEFSIMVRETAIEIKNYIESTDFTNDRANKYIMYGNKGNGKTFTLAYLLSYLYDKDFIIVHVNQPGMWLTKHKEILPNLIDDHLYDHTIDAAQFLVHFKNQNTRIIKHLKLKTKKSYEWNVRESTPPGDLLELLNYGIQRPRYASLCVRYLLQEISEISKNNECKIGVVIDGINAIFNDTSHFRDRTQAFVNPERMCLIQAIREFLLEDLKNGLIIGTVDIGSSNRFRKKFDYPLYLLDTLGWDYLDPFVPIHVPCYTVDEFRSAIHYYYDRMWLGKRTLTSKGLTELKVLSTLNPRVLFESTYNKY